MLDVRAQRIYADVAGRVVAIDAAGLRVLGTVEQTGFTRIHDMLLSAGGDLLFVAADHPGLPGNERVWVIDTATLEPRLALAFPTPPLSLELAAEGDLLLVAREHTYWPRPSTVELIDSRSLAPAGSIETPVGVDALHAGAGVDGALGIRAGGRAACLLESSDLEARCFDLPGRFLAADFDAHHGRIVILCEISRGLHRIVVVDPATAAIKRSFTVPPSTALAVNGRTGRLVLATDEGLEVRDTESGELERAFPRTHRFGVIVKDTRRDRFYIGSSAETRSVALSLNLNAVAQVDDPATTTVEQPEVFSTSALLVDPSAQVHVATFTFTPEDNDSVPYGALDQWRYEISLPGSSVFGGAPWATQLIASGTLVFDSQGELQTPAGDVVVDLPRWTDGSTGGSFVWRMYDAQGQGLLTGFADPSALWSSEREDGSGLTVLTGWEPVEQPVPDRNRHRVPFTRRPR